MTILFFCQIRHGHFIVLLHNLFQYQLCILKGKEEQDPTLLTMPSLSTSGGMCVTVPVVFVSTRLTRSRLRASPKSEIFAQKP